MRYNFVPHQSKLISIMATFGGGSRVEGNKYPSGIAHFMEHARFKDTKNHSSQELIKKIAYYGGASNAFTSNDLVNFYIKMPAENIEKAYELLAEIVLYPIFPEADLELEKEVVCQEIRAYEDSAETLAYYKLMGRVFKNNLKNPICGSEESVRTITRDDVVRFNEDVYAHDKMLITLVGPENYESLVRKHFGKIDDKLIFPKPEMDTEFAPSFTEIFEKEGNKQDTISVSFGSTDFHKNIKQNIPVSYVFNNIFGGGSDSRLFMKVREELGLVYGIGSDIMNMMDGSLFDISTDTEPENTDKVLEAIDIEIKKAVTELPTDEEMIRSKNLLRSSIYAALESSSGKGSKSITKEFMGYDDIDILLEKIDKVTDREVLYFANELFTQTNKYTVICKGTDE